jgi:hypothetical protein
MNKHHEAAALKMMGTPVIEARFSTIQEGLKTEKLPSRATEASAPFNRIRVASATLDSGGILSKNSASFSVSRNGLDD